MQNIIRLMDCFLPFNYNDLLQRPTAFALFLTGTHTNRYAPCSQGRRACDPRSRSLIKLIISLKHGENIFTKDDR